jgi:hypothetical protein
MTLLLHQIFESAFSRVFRCDLSEIQCCSCSKDMAEPIAKRQRTGAVAEVCTHGGCDDLKSAARACCLACLRKLANAEPPLHREELLCAVQYVAGRSSWNNKAKPELDCCGSLNILLTAAGVASVKNSDHKPYLSLELEKASKLGCLHCTLALLRYLDTHLGDKR